ncbi:MAG: universal stress protein [Magnetococcales bacterium]|nr:universal stress protein [Magnetococcales bacterium]NGZ28482.1 universal stress protein [Magnetococcales bacterium]
MTAQLSPTGRFEKLLLASDGTEYTESAQKIALAMAKLTGAKLVAMRMVLSNPEYDSLVPDMAVRMEMAAYDSLLGITAEGEKLGVTCTPMVMHGSNPHEDIIEAAEKVGADVIVMGRRGSRGLARLMLGDATARVVAQAHCQVLVVPRMTQLWSHRILLATDGSRYSDSAAVSAIQLAKLSNLPLLIMTACPNPGNDSVCRESEQVISRLMEHASQRGVMAESMLVEGDPVQAILDTAAKRGVDLIVGGSHGRTGMEKVFLGSVMERVMGKATCPVLTVKG